jgi:hypothetical protein
VTDTMLNVPLVQLISELISESLDIFSYSCCMGVLVERVYKVFVAKCRQTSEITIFLGEFESSHRKPVFVYILVQSSAPRSLVGGTH